MTTEKKADANRRNARKSTGPKTGEGVLACKNNALRHGLRALQILVPGEDPDEWEAHREAVVADLRPEGVVELALAEDVALKLWRLGRVVRYEADLIANDQDPDELAHAHERAHSRMASNGLKRTDIPTRKDVASAAKERNEAEEKLAEWDEALRQLEALATMADDDAFPDWTLYVALRDDFFRRRVDVLEDLFQGENLEAAFLARHARKVIVHVAEEAADAGSGGLSSDPEEILRSLAETWREKRTEIEKKALRLKTAHKSLRRRYEAALERRRLAKGLPGPDDLDRVQRYEAHLERGLHKALDRLRDLQEGRGAVPPRGPAVAVAVVHTGRGDAAEGKLGPFGNFALEGAVLAREGGDG